MALLFPNRSRSYDSTLQRIRFIGYDGVFEIPFFIEIDALSVLTAQATGNKAEHLSAFDAMRKTIQDAARRAYTHGRQTFYVLTLSDFQ